MKPEANEYEVRLKVANQFYEVFYGAILRVYIFILTLFFYDFLEIFLEKGFLEAITDFLNRELIFLLLVTLIFYLIKRNNKNVVPAPNSFAKPHEVVGFRWFVETAFWLSQVFLLYRFFFPYEPTEAFPQDVMIVPFMFLFIILGIIFFAIGSILAKRKYSKEGHPYREIFYSNKQ